MNETLLTWLVFILAFSGMVIIHEMGHFIAARLCKIEVEEFGIGLPTPGAITLFTWKGTRFTLNWLPLGGFVRPKGENDPTVQGGLAAATPWRRFIVLVAGPAMNLLTAVLIYSFIFYRVGVPDTSRVMVSGVMADSPAEEAGIQEGDIFISGNGNPIGSFDELRVIVDANAGKPVVFQVDRAGKEIELSVTPKLFEDEQRVMIGVGLGTPFVRSSSPVETLSLGTRYTYSSIRNLLSLPAQMIRGTLTPEQSRVIGLKGIFDIVGQTVSQDIQASENAAANTTPSTDPMDQPIRTLDLIAALSISLGVFNLFPFPALDGGRIIFLLPELIFRRRVPANVENLIHGLGMTVLLLFMIYVNVMDFVNPVNIVIP
ncbi:MAG: M50 family metallopeptidase [Anaerolineales bacterium]